MFPSISSVLLHPELGSGRRQRLLSGQCSESRN